MRGVSTRSFDFGFDFNFKLSRDITLTTMSSIIPLHNRSNPTAGLRQTTSTRYQAPGRTSAPTAASQLYASLPLRPGSRSIRLLDLESLPTASKLSKTARAEVGEAHLQGRLRVACLADSPHFTALSYVWGEPSTSPRDVIRCGTCVLPLTTNGADALRALRRKLGKGQILTIWVDALCINQADKAEKEDQIPLMEDIYQWADPVLVWLGNPSVETDRAFDYMCWLTTRGPHRRSIQALPRILPQSVFTRVQLRLKYLFSHVFLQWNWLVGGLFCVDRASHLQKSFSADLEDILSRKWFYRAWTFQELVCILRNSRPDHVSALLIH